jgi:hypothetical protein
MKEKYPYVWDIALKTWSPGKLSILLDCRISKIVAVMAGIDDSRLEDIAVFFESMNARSNRAFREKWEWRGGKFMPEAGKVISLEVVEIELALGAQDIVADGFEGAPHKAAELVDGKLVFNDRAPENASYQRVAAISVPDGSTDQTVYVWLGNDGMTMTVTLDKEDSHLDANSRV